VNIESNAAVEVVRFGLSASVLVTCEHASEQLPAPWSFTAEDSWLGGTHWAHDLGAAELSRDLCLNLETVGVLARFSRLLVDPNRPADAPDLFRRNAEGRVVALNRGIDAAEADRRMVLWNAYHRALDAEVVRSPAAVLLAVHTFTPCYEGASRDMEIGVLFDEEEALADRLRRALGDSGFRVAMNEPYSGKDGLMYSVDRHARRHGRRALELEMRQDLAVTTEARRRVVGAIVRVFDSD
jgi:predicted N-formylglutamate amidohydrolase